MESSDAWGWLWMIAVFGGPILLAIAFIYGIRRSRRQSQNLIVDREQEIQKKREASRLARR